MEPRAEVKSGVPEVLFALESALTDCAAMVSNVKDGTCADDPERWAQAAAHLAGAIEKLRYVGYVR